LRQFDRIGTVKKLIPAVAMILSWALAAWPAPPAPLTTLREIHALTNDQANHKLPVAFEATVTYYRGYETNLFVQDGDAAIYVQAPTDSNLLPGDRVLVKGKTQGSFNPIVISESITLLRHEAPLKPEPASYDRMIRAETDCKVVTVRGLVRTADRAKSLVAPVYYIRLQLLMDGGYFDANLDSDDQGAIEDLLDSEVELTGVASEEFDSKMHETGILMHIQSLSDVKIVEHSVSSPWLLPVTPMDRVITVSHLNDSTPRVRVHGIITYYQPGSAVVLQDGEKSIWISTLTYKPLRLGDEADATGFPDAHDGFINLVHGEIRDTGVHAPITPLPATWESLTPRGYDSPGHHYDLVSIEGRVVTEVHEASQDEFVLAIDGKQFSVIFRHPDGPVPFVREIPLGSRVRVTGICVLEYSNPFIAQVPFKILLRSFDDVELVQRPSLLNVRNLVIVVGLLLVVVAVVGGRGWALERKLRQKTAALANSIEAEAALERRSTLLEQKRSRILEDINGSQTLAKVLTKIAEMVSFSLDDAPCWCEVADGTMMGNCPPEPHDLRVVRVQIETRSGPALGTIFAAMPQGTEPTARETEALSNGARLASLAIETRRLYSDLRHRSEFDLLTDIYNRFSLHKRLDILIQEADESRGAFGLIYIDLDKFKPINDTYGHHVGDAYLQAVAGRMNDQLLGGDMLARLGGDEFAALVGLQRGRSDLERIVKRLEGCFDAPFVIDGHVIKGMASIGLALYPDDGTTKDALLNAADASMYAIKNERHQAEKTLV
jgi:diguanylate cyclase (GGDEF)-like protein